MISFIIGTRAELIKTFPLIKKCYKSNLDFEFIGSGQHNLDNLCNFLNIEPPKMYLTFPPKKEQKYKLKIKKGILGSLNIVINTYKYVKKSKPKLVLVHGDTATTTAVSLGVKFTKAKLAHIEAGLRSKNIFEPFPEEISRIITDHLSNYLFSVSERASKNLKNEKVSGEIFQVGNTIVDSVYYALKFKRTDIELPEEEYAVATVHRFENLKFKNRLTKIVKILIGASKKIKILFFTHQNTVEALKKYKLYTKLKKCENIEIRDVVDYVSFLKYMKNSKLIFTDGGSMQEESLILKIPCIILRKYTERIEGLYTGINYLSKLEYENTLKAVEYFLSLEKIPKFKNPYGNVGVSKKIINILKEKI